MNFAWTICCLLLIGKAQGFTSPHPQLFPTSSSPRPGIDFHGPLWLPRSYKIVCCRGGTPHPENPKVIRNWTQTVSDFALDERSGVAEDEGCHHFEGSFLLAVTAMYSMNTFAGFGVQCSCPKFPNSSILLDRHCRRLPPCQNGGYRSATLSGRCSCPEPYFGDNCEKLCDQGQKLKGVDGRDYCSCVPFYQGEECRDMMCLNGGVEVSRRCSCPTNFLGYHCEIDGNRTAITGGRFQRFGDGSTGDFFTRDISGTVFSMIMIIVLVISMYLLMKHRMQVQHHLTRVRREQFVHPIYATSPRRADGLSPDEIRSHFFTMGIEGPPPYLTTTRGRPRREPLPPLPSYEDATKLPPLRRAADNNRESQIDNGDVTIEETVLRQEEPNERRSSDAHLQRVPIQNTHDDNPDSLASSPSTAEVHGHQRPDRLAPPYEAQSVGQAPQEARGTQPHPLDSLESPQPNPPTDPSLERSQRIRRSI